MGRSMAEGVRIMRIMITLTDKGFRKEAAAEPSFRIILPPSPPHLQRENQPRFHAPIRSSLIRSTPRDHHGAMSKRFNRLERKTRANYLQTAVTSLGIVGPGERRLCSKVPRHFQKKEKVPGFNWRAGDLMLSGFIDFCLHSCLLMDTKAGSGLLITRTKKALKGRRSAAQVRDEPSNQRPAKKKLPLPHSQ